MRKTLATILLAATSAAAAAGCGGSSPLTKAKLVSKADAICAASRKQLVEQTGVSPGSPAAFVAYDAKAKPVQRDSDSKLADLKPPKSEESTWKQYVDARKEATKLSAEQAKVAATGAVNLPKPLAGRQQANGQKRQALARKLGLHVCGNQADLPQLFGPPSPGSPQPGVSYTKPAEPLSAGVTRFKQAAAKGNCDALRAIQNSDDPKLPQAACAQSVAGLKGLRVLATQDFGPVGVVDFLSASGTVTTQLLVMDQHTGRYTLDGSSAIESGAAHPAPSGQDPLPNAEKAVEAIRKDDGAAFHQVVSEGTDFYAKRSPKVNLVNPQVPNGSGRTLPQDLRADSSAKPVLLGKDTAYAFFMLKANGHSYVLIAQRGATGYKLAGFYPLPAS